MGFQIANEPAADQVLDEYPFAVVVGMMLDQQYGMEHAFRGGYKELSRFGTLDPAAIAAADPAEFKAMASTPPAIHRFPGSMAARLQELARIQRGGADGAPGGPSGPRLSRLEHARPREEPPESDTANHVGGDLTDKQRGLLRTLSAASSVSAAAIELGVSRSNVYASLRRIIRKNGHESVPELLRLLRAGQVVVRAGDEVRLELRMQREVRAA